MFNALTEFLSAHPAIRGALYVLLVAVAGAFFNWATWQRTPEAWAAYRLAHPRLATLILVTRALLPHLRKIPAIATFIPPAPLILLTLFTLAGCASWFAKTPQHVVDVAVLVECIIAHDTEPPAQIVVECAAENEQQVIDLIAAEKKAAQKHRDAVCGGK